MKIISVAIGLLLSSLSVVALAEELTLQERQAKLEECYSYCADDTICIANCQQAFGDDHDQQDEEEICD